jgi:F-type H+-transporting ATPase subunit b
MGRCRLLTSVLLCLLVLGALAAGSACAADPHGGHGGGGASSGEPEIFKPALDLGIWTLVVFLVLLFILGRYAWKPMLEGLRRREENIHEAVAEAQRARDDAQRLRDQLQSEIDRAHETVRDIVEEGRRAAKHTTDEMNAKARGEIQGERERLHREIAMARDQALQQLWSEAAQLATTISAKAIRRQLNADDHRRLVDEALAELRGAGSERQREVAGARS